MDNKTLFIRTGKGEDEVRNKTALLYGDVKRALLMVDGTATFGEISKRAAPSLRGVLDEMFKELEKGGFIQDKAKAANIPKMVVPPKMSVPGKKLAEGGGEELDFTAAFRAPSSEVLAAEAAKLKAQQEAEAARHKAEQEAALVRAELEATKIKAEAEAARIRAEAEAKARTEAEAKARREIEAAKLKAQQEAEAARFKAEQEAAKAREEAEAARVKAKQEVARMRAELEAAKAKAEAEAKAREETERRAREETEAARLKAQQREAEAAQIKAEQEAARIKAEAEAKARAEADAKAKEEAERRAREEAEAARLKAQQEAEAAQQKAEQEAKAREEAEHRAREEEKLKAQQEAEAARIKAEQEAARIKAEAEAKARAEAETKAHEEAELVRQKATAEAKAREETELKEEAERRDTEAMLLKSAQDAAQASVLAEAGKIKPGDVPAARSTIATVLFFDVVGYTKQSVNKQIKVKKRFNQLLSDCLTTQSDGDRIILDTGDGAAIGFLQHPEDALEVAMQFRKTVMANEHKNFPDLKVRIGIHLGPVNIIQDVNGQNNMVGDGINDAQRVMSFAGTDQIYISRSYYDFVSRLSDEYADLFQYRGSQQDKHGREHPVYELVDALATAAEVALPQAGEAAPAVNLEPFSFVMPEAKAAPAPAAYEEPESQQDDDTQLLSDAGQLNRPEKMGKPDDAEQAAQQQPPSQADAAGKPPKEAAKPVAKAHMPSDEEVRKLAEAQAKTWAGAEQRAAEAARASAERAAQPLPEGRGQRTEDRKPSFISRLTWGKAGAGLFVLLLIALFAVPYLLPTQGYAARIEQLLTARLQQPVHIGQLAGRLLPVPRLELSNISIGEAKQIQVQQAQVNFALSALFSSNKPINAVELEGVQISNADLTQISAWLPKIAADTQYPIALIKLSQGRLEAEGVQLSGIGGEIGFTQAGKFTQAKLYAEGNKFALDINAMPENKMQASITVRGGALPLLPDWVFDDLSAKGELNNDELMISNLDGRIMGGTLLGSARIGWRSGWHAQVALEAKDITLQNMSKALNGDMDGTARFRMQAASLPKLVETSTMDGAFVIKKGIISGMDIVETARLRSRENLPGGRTHFDGLSGNLSVADGVYAFRQLKMNAGVLTATGTLDIAKQQLSGRILADLSMRAGMGSVALQIGGATNSPTLRAVP